MLNNTRDTNSITGLERLKNFAAEQSKQSKKAVWIGIYDQNLCLVGFKADTFWNLSVIYPKTHSLTSGGTIPTHLIESLQYAVDAPDTHRKLKVKCLYIGYVNSDGRELIPPVITHRIDDGTIREITQEKRK